MPMKHITIIMPVTLVFILGCSPQAEEVPASSNPVQSAGVVEIEKQPGLFMRIEEVIILGKAGFDPTELTINAGDIVAWTNHDAQGKAAVLTFQKDSSREFMNSGVVSFEGTWTYNFEEPGVYEYWTQGYGVKGKIIVE